MTVLLQVLSSIHSSAGQSSQLAARFVARWRQRDPGVRVITRDLALEPVPHLDAATFAAWQAPAAQRTLVQAQLVAYADMLLAELRQADAIVLGLPMYNFGVPSTLKAYFDQLARAGVTFRYTPHGPVGLLGGKKAYVLATRGGLYAGTPKDTQTGHVRDFFRLIGIDEVEFVYAEGLNLGETGRAAALEEARCAIERLHATDPASPAAYS